MLPAVSLLGDLNQATASALASPAAQSAVRLGDIVYFTADDGEHVNALWRTDGTADGTALVKTIGGTPGSASTLAHLTAVGDKIFFTVDNGTHGDEVWISDGTAEGTKLLLDINKKPIGTGASRRPASSNASDFVAVGNRVFFTADNGTNGRELWVSNGTKAGTYMIRDIDPFNTRPEGSQGPNELTRVGNRVFFWARDGSHGRELWVSDGTKGGTRLVRDLNPGKGDGAPIYYSIASDGQDDGSSMVVIGSTLYFAGTNGKSGVELWKTNGTSAGTTLVKDINPGGPKRNPDSSSPLWLTSFNNKLYFSADDGVHGRQLWKSDGTSAGTRMLAAPDVQAAPNGLGPRELTVFKNRLYFIAPTADGGEALWVSDGTIKTTSKIQDIAPPLQFDVQASATRIVPQGQDLFKGGGKLYFTSITDTHGRELWTTDGTPEGTRLVKDIRPGEAGSEIGFLSPLRGKILFAANNGETGRELWLSDGTAEGTQIVVDLNQKGADSLPSDFVQAGSKVFFVADDGKRGRELWVRDGAGTRLVKDIRSGVKLAWSPAGDAEPAGSDIHSLTAAGNRVFFVANDGEHGEELWVSDGSAGGTRMVRDLGTAELPAFPGQLTALGNRVYFVADDGETGRELWVSDGTEAGTKLVRDINEGQPGQSAPASSDPSDLAVLGEKLVFAASDGKTGRELWVSDGTAEGTTQLKNINPEKLDEEGDIVGPQRDSNPLGLTRVGASLFFSADNGKGGAELWRTDGTSAGTVLVRNINRNPIKGKPGKNAGSSPRDITAVGDTAFFVANDGSGTALWKSDGTRDGTVLVRKIGAEPGKPPTIQELTAVGNSLYFTASTVTRGIELWTSDGTPTGTRMVKDIFPGDFHIKGQKHRTGFSSNPSNLTAFAGQLFFVAEDGTQGRELWRSNGTREGSLLVEDVWPGARAGLDGVSGLTASSEGLLFSASDGVKGFELWQFVEDPLPVAEPEPAQEPEPDPPPGT